jgi:hypothetical protein
MIMDVLKAVAQEPYESRGIIHSEMGLLIHAAHNLGVKRIVESGRARGQSTYLLAKYLPDVEIHSVELRDSPDNRFSLHRLAGLENVTCYYGDGGELVPIIVDQSDKPTAILCDGPKGAAAVDILVQCFQRPQVRVGFIHDMRRLDHGGPSPHRQYAIDHLPNAKFSDDPILVAGSSWMDAKVAEAGGPCGPQFEAVHGSYGPTLGVFLNPQQSSNQ